MNSDCEVCQKLIKEKHRNDFIWKVLCILFAIGMVVFMCLYFCSGALVTETTIEVTDSDIGSQNEFGGDNNNLVIGGQDTAINGTITTENNATLLICCAVIIGALIIAGGIIIACHIKKSR